MNIKPLYILLLLLAPWSLTEWPLESKTHASPQTSYPFTNDQIIAYLKQITPELIARSLSTDESQLIDKLFAPDIAPESIEQNLILALEGLTDQWRSDKGFLLTGRVLLEQITELSGQNNKTEIDYTLPGNLMEYIIQNDLPLKHIITADYCVYKTSGGLEKRACDTNADYSSGIVNTRAYMKKNAGSFNLHRASELTNKFLCVGIPNANDHQKPIAFESLIPMFQNTDGEETFGNGTHCYSCHNQFAVFSQPFVKFDRDGFYNKHLTGIPSESGNFGISRDGNGYTSHFKDPQRAKSEASKIFNQQINHLGDMTQVIANQARFKQCMSYHLTKSIFNTNDVAKHIITKVAIDLSFLDNEPTYQDFIIHVLKHPELIKYTMSGITQ